MKIVIKITAHYKNETEQFVSYADTPLMFGNGVTTKGTRLAVWHYKNVPYILEADQIDRIEMVVDQDDENGTAIALGLWEER